MSEWVLAVGVLITVVTAVLMLRPDKLPGLLDGVFGSRWLYGAALLRLLLGAALIASAATVKYPQAVALFGWLFVLGGLLFVVIPAPVLRRMVNRWFGQLSPAMSRLWLCAALAFGLFLVYAALP